MDQDRAAREAAEARDFWTMTDEEDRRDRETRRCSRECFKAIFAAWQNREMSFSTATELVRRTQGYQSSSNEYAAWLLEREARIRRIGARRETW